MLRKVTSRLIAATGVAALIVGGSLWLHGAEPTEAAIHEIVASHCSFEHHANLDPLGQIRFGEQSFLRALFATGVYTDVIFGEDPDGNPGPFVTVVGDFDQPASKFSWDGESYESFFEPDLGVTVFVPAVEADHAGLLHCHNLQP